MMGHEVIIERSLQTLNSLNNALPILLEDAMRRSQLDAIIENELFSPAEEEVLAYWFARFIDIRHNYWEIVSTAIRQTGGTSQLENKYDWHYFVLAYSAVCSLVRMDRFLLTKVAYHSIIQRKLNEPVPKHRIDRKQYSKIYSSLLLPANALRIHQAHRLINKKALVIKQAISGHDELERIFSRLPKQERYLNLSWRQYCMAWILSRKHVWKRRGASAQQKSKFAVLEYSGRIVSEMMLPRPKNVTQAVLKKVSEMVRPGDVFITRHNRALTNLFLPGFWPHAALYVGYASDRERLSITAEQNYLAYWNGQNCTFEALKDGVRFRSLQETLNVDAFVIVRPSLSQSDISEAISRAVTHAGKGYNFDFDFFRSDRLVCTEVIYRAYDGINGMKLPLAERMGMKTLSAEDILDLSLESDWSEVIAVYGVGDAKQTLVTGDSVHKITRDSYQ